MADELLVNVHPNGVMVATMNRPDQGNSLSPALLERLFEEIDRASADDAVRVLVLTGAGKAFCAGAVVQSDRDPTQRSNRGRQDRMDRLGTGARMAQALAGCDKPIIASINGTTAGAGFGMALASDLRIMAASARLGPIFIKRGLGPDNGVSYWLPRIIGLGRAFEVMYDGGLIASDRALALGLANRVVPDAELEDATMELASQIAAGPPLAYTATRRILHRSSESALREQLELEWTYQLELLKTADTAEGFRSFVERRDPVFNGE